MQYKISHRNGGKIERHLLLLSGAKGMERWMGGGEKTERNMDEWGKSRPHYWRILSRATGNWWKRGGFSLSSILLPYAWHHPCPVGTQAVHYDVICSQSEHSPVWCSAVLSACQRASWEGSVCFLCGSYEQLCFHPFQLQNGSLLTHFFWKWKKILLTVGSQLWLVMAYSLWRLIWSVRPWSGLQGQR